jgi:uncharacterized iron-regulated protein
VTNLKPFCVGSWWAFAAALSALLLIGCASPAAPVDEHALAAELARRPSALLGEVHDNEFQHRMRADALRLLLQQGARPAIAFEQFDRERQSDIDRARTEVPADGRSLAAHVIERGRTPKTTWDWAQYEPFVELALRFDLPIVAANLSRADATRVARDGVDAVFDAEEQRRLGLDRLDASLQHTHESIAREAHCRLLPETALAGLARAQIARDAVLADAFRRHPERGAILLTGNGHARRDIGVPRHLTAAERVRVWSIGLIEAGSEDRAGFYDVAFLTPRHERADPCAALRPKERQEGPPG